MLAVAYGASDHCWQNLKPHSNSVRFGTNYNRLIDTRLGSDMLSSIYLTVII